MNFFMTVNTFIFSDILDLFCGRETGKWCKPLDP